MKEFLKIKRPGKAIDTEIGLPSSKSISNRLLIMQHLSGDKIEIDNLSTAEDTRAMESLLHEIRVHTRTSNTSEPWVIDCGNAGTVLRFLTALLAISPGKWFITGTNRMQHRPVEPLVRSLSGLGARIVYTGKHGYPPLHVTGTQIPGGRISVDTSVSSQFLSALLMVGTVFTSGLTIETSGDTVSRPYADMTLGLLRQAGINIKVVNGTYIVYPGVFNRVKFTVEPDWSSASYWYEIAALIPGSKILLKGLSMESLQGDRIIADVFRNFGITTIECFDGLLIANNSGLAERFSYDFSDCPDIVPAVAASCAALGVQAELTGLAHLRIKESNRVEALVQELKKVNNSVSVRNHSEILIGRNDGSISTESVAFNTYGDHRMAMALAPMAALFEIVTIEDPEVVRKSYPDFWKDLQNAGFLLNRH